MADKIRNDPNQSGVIEGENIRIDDTGMATFYDRIVPNVANDVLKKLGGGRVGEVPFKTSAPYTIVKDGDFWAVATVSSSVRDSSNAIWKSGFSSWDEAFAAGKEQFASDSGLNKTQSGFDITPAMKELVAAGLPLFSRNTGAGGMQTKDVDAVVDMYRAKLRGLPKTNVWKNVRDLPEKYKGLAKDIKAENAENDVAGAWYDGEIHLFADNLRNPEHAERVMLHEATHHGLRNLFGSDLNPTLMSIYMKNQGIKDAAKKIREQYPDMSIVTATEEVLADMGADNIPQSIWNQLIAGIRSVLRKLGIKLELSDNDVKALVTRALNFVKTPHKGTDIVGGTAFSVGESNTITIDGRQRSTVNSNGQPLAQTEEGIRNFWKWFGDSRVVDAQGRPLVVYHGTQMDFSIFRGGRGYESGGIFFSPDSAIASAYAGVDPQGNFHAPEIGNVMPAYLRVEALKVVDFNGDKYGRPAAIKKARADGFDGVLLQRHYDAGGVQDQYVVFDAYQIKSSTGNDGQFSPSNPDIRYSRNSLAGAVETIKSNAAQNGRLNTVFDLLDNANKFGALSKLQTQFHKAKKDLHFKRVFDAVHGQINDVSHYALESESEAPRILQRMDGAKDVWNTLKQGNKAAQNDLKAASKAVFANIEGMEGVQQKVFTDAELTEQFQLTPKQIELYREFRAAVDSSLDRLSQTLMMKTAGQYVDTRSLKNMGMDETRVEIDAMLAARQDFIKDRMRSLDDERRAAEANRTHSVGFDEFGKERHSSTKDKTPTEEGLQSEIDNLQAVRDRLKEMAEYTNELKAKGYSPAMRFGQYAVTVKNGEEVEFFSMYETQTEANIARMQLMRDPAYKGMEIKKSTMNPDAWKMFAGVSPETVDLFARFMGADESDAFKAYVSLVTSSRSAMKRMLDRKGIAGFSIDTQRVLAQFVTSNARQSAMNINSREINEALHDIPKEKGDVQKEAQDLVDYTRNPTEEAAALRGFLFLHFIGGSIASAFVNTTQPVLMTTPYLHQFAGNKIAGIMASALKMATAGKIADAGLRNALQRADEDGITKPHEIHMLMAEASGGTLGRFPRWQAFKKAWGGFFALSEAWNRKVTFIAAFETGRGMSKEAMAKAGFANAYDFAVNAVHETQGIYNKANRPDWARGAIGATLFTFKQYSIAYLEFLSRLPRKQQMLALGMLVLAAGAEGLPFADDLEDLIDTLGQKLGYATNSKKAIRQFMAGIMGDGLSEYALHGFSALPGMPIDVSARLGMSNLIPGTALLNPSRKDKSNEVLEVFGAAGGLAKGLMTAVDSGRASETMPSAIKNGVKAYEMWNTGEYRDSKGRRVTDADGIDALAKAIGFQPAHVAADTRRILAERRDVDIVKNVEADIADDWARGIIDKKPELVAQARDQLRQWNEDNKDMPIRITPAQIARRVKEARLTRDQRFIKSAPPELRRRLMGELVQ
jgi:hypothetical protein